jgi:hypothetical protein
MKIQPYLLPPLGLLAATTVYAAVFPYFENFDANPTGTSAPQGWRQGPPVGTVSIGAPWSVAEVEGWGKVYQFKGAGDFDGNGRAYATVEIGGLPTASGDSWETSVDFRLTDLVMDGPTDSFRFGMGVLGSYFMFSNGRGGGFGGNDFYLIDWGFTLPEQVRQLPDVPMTYRILEWGPLGVIERGLFSGHIPAGFFNSSDRYRMVVQGIYAGTSLTLKSWVDNLDTLNAVPPVEVTIANPMTGPHFGLRFTSGSGVTTVNPPSFNALGQLTIHMDNFKVAGIGQQPPSPAVPFWAGFQMDANGWRSGWLGTLYDYQSSGWAAHADLGLVYSPSQADGLVWLYLPHQSQLGWLATSSALYPYLRTQSGDWYYLFTEPEPLLVSLHGQAPVFLGE